MSKVKIEGNASGTGTLTISAPNTNTDRSLTLPDGAGEIVVSSGGALPALDGSALTNLPTPTVGYGAFQAVMSNSQSISNATSTKIEFVSEVKDYESFYDVNNKRYQPDTAGLYFIYSRIQHETPYNGDVRLVLYKNGSIYTQQKNESPNTSDYPSAVFSGFVPLNGTTDYVEMYVYHTLAINISIYGTSNEGGFGGYLVRAD